MCCVMMNSLQQYTCNQSTPQKSKGDVGKLGSWGIGEKNGGKLGVGEKKMVESWEVGLERKNGATLEK